MSIDFQRTSKQASLHNFLICFQILQKLFIDKYETYWFA